MNSLMRSIFLIVATISFCILINRYLPRTQKKNDRLLIVGTSDDYPPYSFTKNGTIVGFDIDIVKEVAHRLGKTIVLKNLSFDVLLLELTQGTIEVVASGLSPQPLRREKIFFTRPHITGDPLFIVQYARNDHLSKRPHLHGKKVIVNEGYSADFYLSEDKAIDLVRVETIAEALLALKRGRVDLFVCAKSALKPFLNMNKSHEFTFQTMTGIYEQYSLAISKKYPHLLKEIQIVLDEMAEDGTIDDLKQKWKI